jgi:hypothetical protein
MDASPIYLLDSKANPIGPCTREQVLASLRRKEIQRSDAAWQAGLNKWMPIEDILFKHYRGIDRVTYLGLNISIIGYFIISYYVLRELKISPFIILEKTRQWDGMIPLEHFYVWLGINVIGCVLAAIFLLPRLSHAGLSRWWALFSAIPVIGWFMWIPGLLLPWAFRETRASTQPTDDQAFLRSPPASAPDVPDTLTPPPPAPAGVLKELSFGHRLRRVLKSFAFGGILEAAVVYCCLYIVIYSVTITLFGTQVLQPGNIAVPSERNTVQSDSSDYLNQVLIERAQRSGLEAMMARLALGKDIPGVNEHLQNRRVTGVSGTYGNWDFRLTALITLIYNFGDDPELIYPETLEHIVEVLLNERGGDPQIWTPKIFGLPLQDTENHILQTESSRYLTNQWIARQGNPDPKYDNIENGLETWLLGYLQGIETGGLFEYNSFPYAAYALRPLLNLEAFAAEPVAASARRILDRMNWEYALGSLSLRSYPPMCRHRNHASVSDLTHNYEMALMKAWMSLYPDVEMPGPPLHSRHAIWAAMTSYRLPDTVVEWARAKPVDYYVRIGRGRRASAEIYSGGPGYLISAGGVAISLLRDTIARPTVLLLDDDVTNLPKILHLAGPGERYAGWNNTGVYKHFAVAAGPVRIPETWVADAVADHWSVYVRSGQRIGVYSSDSLGIFCLLPEGDPEELARELAQANPDKSLLATRFQQLDGTRIEYDPHARKDTWVLKAVNADPVDRDFQSWPLLQGDGFPPELQSELAPISVSDSR